MSRVTLSIDKKDIIDNIDYDKLLEMIVDDVANDHCGWWAERICEPLQERLITVVKDTNKDLLREILLKVLYDSLDEEDIKQMITDIVKDFIEEECKQHIEEVFNSLFKR